MDRSHFETLVRLIDKVSSRRSALRSLGAAGVGSQLARVLMSDQDLVQALKKKRKKRKKKKACKGLKGYSAAPNRPFPRHTGYAAGSIKPSNFSPDDLDGQVRRAYDRWKERYLVGANCDKNGNRLFRVALSKSGDARKVTVSEGQGYGMIVVATMAGYDGEAQEIFDGLWRFRLAHPGTIDPRLMDWRVPGGQGDDSAFDGDADIAYGLLLANAQWGSDGPIDYHAEALQVIAGILESTIGPQSNLPMLGDWVQPNGDQYNQDTPRTSDFMPEHFRAFGRATGDPVWDDVVDACQDVIASLQANFSPNTGLLPDFVVEGPQPAPPNFLEGPYDGTYSYNAGRDPWRIGTDALLNSDPTSAAQAGAIANWSETATGGDPLALRSGYHLNGAPLPNSNYFSTFFATPIGVAAMTTGLQEWLDTLYGAVYDVQENYYEDSVTLLCLLVMTGNFWDPTLD